MNNWGARQCRARHAPPFGHAEIPWAEAFSTATYIGNRTPAKALDGRTYYEMLYDVKLDLANLHSLGVPCVIVGLSEKLKKRAWTVGWATRISGAHVIHVHGGGLAKLAHCGRSL